jgi:hypothetical protein
MAGKSQTETAGRQQITLNTGVSNVDYNQTNSYGIISKSVSGT